MFTQRIKQFTKNAFTNNQKFQTYLPLNQKTTAKNRLKTLTTHFDAASRTPLSYLPMFHLPLAKLETHHRYRGQKTPGIHSNLAKEPDNFQYSLLDTVGTWQRGRRLFRNSAALPFLRSRGSWMRSLLEATETGIGDPVELDVGSAGTLTALSAGSLRQKWLK